MCQGSNSCIIIEVGTSRTERQEVAVQARYVEVGGQPGGGQSGSGQEGGVPAVARGGAGQGGAEDSACVISLIELSDFLLCAVITWIKEKKPIKMTMEKYRRD